MPRRRNERKPPVTRLQVCRICGEAFETVEEDRDRCHELLQGDDGQRDELDELGRQGMALVKQITKRVEIPHEPGAWVEIRMLSWLRLDEATKRAEAVSPSRDWRPPTANSSPAAPHPATITASTTNSLGRTVSGTATLNVGAPVSV